MPEPVEPAANPAPAQTTAEPGDANPPVSDPQYVTQETFNKVTEQLSGLSALVRRLTSAQPATPANPDTKGNADSKPEDRLAKIEANLAKLKDRTIDVSIREAISGHGVDEESAELLRSYVRTKFKDRLHTDGIDVEFETDLGEKKPVKHLVDEILKGNLGERFKPAKPVPDARGLKGGLPNNQSPTREYKDMSPEERQKLTGRERAAMVQRSLQK